MSRWVFFLFVFSKVALASPCQQIAEGSNYFLQDCAGLKVLHLQGTPESRAFTLGKLTGPLLSPDIVNYFSSKVDESAGPRLGWLRGPARILYNQAVRLLHRATPPALAREIDAMAKGLGRDPITLRRALSLPDTATLVNALGTLELFRALPASGCTSVIARSSSGNFIYGRNLDFSGTDLWDRHPLLLVSLPPPESAELKHAAIAADGMPFAGLTGFNEAGIALAVHQSYSREGSLYGVPMVLLGEMVLRQASTLEEAESILEKNRPAAAWTFIITNLKTGDAYAVETAPSYFSKREMTEGKLVQTNHAMTSEAQAQEFISVGTKMNSLFRMEKAFSMLSSHPRPEEMAKILSFQSDPEGQLVSYRDILKGLTIQTALFTGAPGTMGDLFMSIDPAPTASGRYVKLSLTQLLAGPKGLEAEPVDLTQTPPAKRAHQVAIASAFHRYFDDRDFLGAAKLLEKQNTLDANLFRAVAYYQVGDFSLAQATAEASLADPRQLGEPAYIRESLQWVKLACLWKSKRFDEARSLADELSRSSLVHRRFQQLCDRLGSGKDPEPYSLDLHFEFFTGDLSGRAN